MREMADIKDPILFGTEKDYAWDAYRRGFGAGADVDRSRFETYFDEVYLKLGAYSLHDRMNSAWNVGVMHRNELGTGGFAAWWQQILDSQPVMGSAVPKTD